MKSPAKIHRFLLIYGFWAAILAGFLLSGTFDLLIFNNIIWTISASLLVAISLIIARRWCLLIMILAGIVIGIGRMSSFNQHKHNFLEFVGIEHTVSGIITEDLDQKDGRTLIRLNIISIDKQSASGTLLATTRKITARRSDQITIKGKISAGFGNFSGTIFRANVVKITPKPDIIRDLRDWFSDKIRSLINSPEVDLGLGYLLGQKNSLPESLDQALRGTALSHIVVASGYNLTVLVRFCRRFFAKYSKKLATFFAAILIIGFVLVVGLSPSMTRAGIVALLSLAAWHLGRQTQPLFLLILVAAITLIYNPANLHSLGWQLSFASFFGVMILAPLLKNYLYKNPKNLSSIKQIFFETLSAQIATLPLIILTFKSFSTVSIFANLAVLPLVPISMLFTFLTGVGAIITPLFGKIFAILSSLTLGYSVQAILFFAKIPGAQFKLEINAFQSVMFYLAIILICVYLYFKNNKNLDDQNLIV